MPIVVFSLCCAIWSTTYYGIRVCLRGYAPLTGAALRFLLAGALLWAVLQILTRVGDRVLGFGTGRGAEKRSEQLAIAAAALINATAYSLTYYAETRITGGMAAVLTAASPFFVTVAARFAGLERFEAKRLIGIGIGFCGVAVMFMDAWWSPPAGGLRDPTRLWAMAGMIFGSSVLWPAYNVILKRYTKEVDPVRANFRFLTMTGLWLALAAASVDLTAGTWPRFGSKPTLALVYLAVMGSVVAWTGYFWMLKRLDISTMSLMVFIQPTAALLVDVAMGDNRLTTRGYLGAALVLVGVVLAVVKLGKNRPQPPDGEVNEAPRAPGSEVSAR